MDLVTVNDSMLANFGAAAAALSGDTKAILKCEKGDWYLGQGKEEIKHGTRFALNMSEAQWGWLLWRDKKVDDRRMAAIASGQPIPARGSLGHDDKDLWDRGADGKPIDPWSKTIELPARELDGEQREVMMSGSSKGWEGCCKALFKAFGEGMRANSGKIPIVELSSGKYTHSDYGIVKVPVLNIVDWKAPAELAAPAPAKSKAKF
jgi:hypothetical protein